MFKRINYIFGTCKHPESLGKGSHQNVINNNKTIIKEDAINKLQISEQGKAIGK